MSSPKKKKATSRHGMRAEGKTQTSITIDEALLEKARAAARADGRSVSNWFEQLVKKSLPTETDAELPGE